MFQFPGFASLTYGFSQGYHKVVGFPIRTSSDQRLLPSPRSFSQGATSFIASECQGIHQMPFSRLRARTQGQNPRTGYNFSYLRNHPPIHSGPHTGASRYGLAGSMTDRTVNIDLMITLFTLSNSETEFPGQNQRSCLNLFPVSTSLWMVPAPACGKQMVEADGIEPTTYGLQSRRSPN